MGNAGKKSWPVIVIVLLWLVFARPYVFKGLVPFPSDYLVSFFPPWSSQYAMPVKNNAMPDVITQIYPWKKLTVDVWKSGSVPLWNPYGFSGTPHAGNYQTAVFSPVNLLFFVLPFLDAWSIMILVQPLLAGLFMYLLARSLDRSRAASTLAGIAFMFSGFITVWMAYGTLGYAALFLPLVFWGVHTKRGWAISAGIAVSFLSGHLQTSLYVLSAAAAYILWKKQRKQFLYVVAGLLIAAPQILLGLHSFVSSTRGSAVLKGDVIPWQYLVTFIAPDFFGNPVTRNDWFGHYAEWAGFVGVATLLLALFAAVKKRTKDVWFFVLLGAVALLFALPTPLNDLLYILKIPVLSGSAASRIIILTSFSLAVLSAYGADALRPDRKFAVSIVAAVGIVWLLLFAGVLPPDKLAVAKHNFVLPTVLVIAAVVFMNVKQRLAIYALIALTAVDVLRFAAKWMPFTPRRYVYPQIKSALYVQKNAGANRVFGNIGNEVGATYRLQLTEGYDAVYQARYGEFMQYVSKGFVSPGLRSVVQFDKNGLYKTEALQLLGVRYIYHRLSDGKNVWTFPYWEYPGMRQVYSDGLYGIFEYPDAFPRAFLASGYVIGGINDLFAQNFNRRENLVLEEKPDNEPKTGDGSAEITDYQPNTVVIKTASAFPKLLFLSDVYDAGWKATVDGKPAKIYRADYDFRAVSLPAGSHTVVFRYSPWELPVGLVLSVIGLLMSTFYTRYLSHNT